VRVRRDFVVIAWIWQNGRLSSERLGSTRDPQATRSMFDGRSASYALDVLLGGHTREAKPDRAIRPSR
jgi:hypothetical protein